MSRMFQVLSGGSSARSSDSPPGGRAAGMADPGAAEIPFVEIGGPEPVYSRGLNVLKMPEPVRPAAPAPASVPVLTTLPAVAPAPAPVPVPDPEPEPEPEPKPATAAQTVAERTFPRLAAPKYLSVTFHDLTGRPRKPLEQGGPDSGLVALHLPDHPISGEYRTLRDEIRIQLPDPSPRVLWFTAAASESGTTSVLLNLAVTLAREAAPRVLVVDANFERPAIAERFALARQVNGLAEVLTQQMPLAWAVQASTIPNLQLLPAGKCDPSLAATLHHDLPKLIEQLRQWYDWVLIDSGIWGGMPERDGVCSLAEAVYLVTRERDVDRSEFAGLRSWVKELGGLLRGYIATKV